MKLINCHIVNYGKLSGTDYPFDGVVTQFCELNGFGKTTLASFIKAMFYGLPTAKENTKEFNDRKRFYPFNGGKFGGNLTFETGGNEYRIERFFDKKSETKDECTVYCNNQVFTGFGNEIGKAVFGLDKDSFERTVFITADALDVCATSSINAKLNNFVDDTESGVGFDDALEALEKAKKRFKAAKGNNDSISKKQAEITAIKDEINNIEKIADGLENLYSQSGRLRLEIAEGEKRMEKAVASNQTLERWNNYEAMLAKKTADEQALKELKGLYPDGIPSKDEIARMKKSSREILDLTGQKRAAGFDESKKARLEVLSQTFAEGVPDARSLQNVQRDIDGVKELEVKINSQKSQQKSASEIRLEQRFGRGVPSDEEMQAAAAKVERYRTLERELKIAAQPATENSSVRKSNKVFIIAAIIAVIVAAAGVGLIFVNAIAGGVIIGAGAAALLATGFLYLKNINAAVQPVRVNENAVKLQAEMKGLEEGVREFLVPYSYYSQNGVVFDFAAFSSDLQEYTRQKRSYAASQESLNDMQAQLSALTAKVKTVFEKYGLTDGDLQKNYINLQTAAAEYLSLCGERDRAERGVVNVESTLKELNGGINSILSGYKIAPPENLPQALETLDRHSAEMDRLHTSISSAGKEAEEYRQKYNLTSKPEARIEDAAAISQSISEKRREYAILNGRIEDAESYVEQLGDKRNKLEEAEEVLEEYKQKHKILSAAAEMLKSAESNLKEKYVSPIRDKFLYYAGILESALGEKVSVDRNFSVAFEREGENRSDKHLSAGQRSICTLCMRIALIDNMFGGEKPFIIMDDPFVNLDGVHMQKTVQTLKALAKDRQIIYFCCHESRKIN